MVSGTLGGNYWRLSCSDQFGNFRNYSSLRKRAERETKGHPEVGRGRRSAEEPETSPAKSVLRITPAAREEGPRDQCKNPEG